MTEIKPFRGLHYDPEKAGPMETLVAPPYDVVDQTQRDQLVNNNPHNIFSVELPDASLCREETDRYRCANTIFSSWIDSGVMVRDGEPAFYVYDIDFESGSGTYCRRGFIGLVRLADWHEKRILPHEKTFDKVTEDRLNLITATQTQFSPIFMLYRHSDRVAELLASAKAQIMPSVKDAFGNTHRMSAVTGPDITRAIEQALVDSPLYIADGHHRYTTALRYRDAMLRQCKCQTPDSQPFNYIMTYLVDAEDPGLIVLPTHRIVRPEGITDWTELRERAKKFFNIRKLEKSPDADTEALCKAMERELATSPDHLTIGVIADSCAEIWTLEKGKESEAFSPETCKPLRKLDVVLLDDVILKNILGFDSEAEERNVKFSADPVEAIRNLGQDEMLFFMRPTPVHQVLDIADQGLTMPHKSTFFYPKILTGMVVNSLREYYRTP